MTGAIVASSVISGNFSQKNKIAAESRHPCLRSVVRLDVDSDHVHIRMGDADKVIVDAAEELGVNLLALT